MFSVNQKRHISESIQNILRETNLPELPEGEIQFEIRISGAESCPEINIWNEIQDKTDQSKDNPLKIRN